MVKNCQQNEDGGFFRENKKGVRFGVKLKDAVALVESKNWPTATREGWRSVGHIKQLRKKVDNNELSITEAEQMAGGSLSPDRIETWATPNTMDSLPPKSPEALQREMTIARPGRSKPANLRDQVRHKGLWPTPRSNSAMASTITPEHAKDENRCPNLETVVAREWKGGRKPETLELAGRTEDNSLPDKVNAGEGKTGHLNADWVEALMMWPISWSSLEPLPELDWDINCSQWEPDIPRVVTGQKDRAKRLKAIGNGQVPLTAAVAWILLND